MVSQLFDCQSASLCAASLLDPSHQHLNKSTIIFLPKFLLLVPCGISFLEEVSDVGILGDVVPDDGQADDVPGDQDPAEFWDTLG